MLTIVGTVVYGGMVLALFGPQWLAALRRRPLPARSMPPPLPK